MVDVSNYDYTSIIHTTVKPEEYFINSFSDVEFEYDNAMKSTRRMPRILDAKYENADLNEVMTKKCQKHITATQRHALLQVLKKFEDLFDGTLGTWNTAPVELELNDDAKPVCSRPYAVPKLHEMIFKKEVERLVNYLSSKKK